MKTLWICIVLAILMGFSKGELPPPEKSYRILMLLPVSSRSHRNVFIPLAEALADRGHKPVYPFLHEMPFITIATFGIDPRQSADLGNPIHPAYMKNYLFTVDLSTTFGRLINLLCHVTSILYWRNWAIVPRVQKEITAQFLDLPPLLELESNPSLTLMNSHFSTDMSVPLLPTQIEVGGMHCRPGKPLPEDLRSWIDGAGPAGVVYFSLGSVAKGETMPVLYRDMFIEAFRKMKQRVVWKFEGELKGVSKNVLIRKWLPQQDILAHPNVKVFISHGGGLSIKEASYHGVPMLVVPIFGDQPHNADHIASEKRGLHLEWEELTVELILKSLMEIINNPIYKENMVGVSQAFRDQIESPRDRAVFWTEYVIRHKGAPRLRSPAADLSWIRFLMMDVLVLFIAALLGILLIIRVILRGIFRVIFSRRGKIKRE